jgi:hypothetical protein
MSDMGVFDAQIPIFGGWWRREREARDRVGGKGSSVQTLLTWRRKCARQRLGAERCTRFRQRVKQLTSESIDHIPIDHFGVKTSIACG